MEQPTQSRAFSWFGALLVLFGFLCHYLSARAIGATYVAFRDHIGGFLLILIVTAPIIVLLGRRFWRGRRDITWLIVGTVQALFGIFVYINRFSFHG